jgi:ADP-ribosyl-[dinitrogen reductase] hydrolase
VVNQGGDADTTGAIAGMIAGALYGEAAIPGAWLKRLDPLVRKEVAESTEALLKQAPYCKPTGRGEDHEE